MDEVLAFTPCGKQKKKWRAAGKREERRRAASQEDEGLGFLPNTCFRVFLPSF